MFRCAVVAVGLSSMGLAIVAGVASPIVAVAAHATPSRASACSVENGQALINDGRYGNAIREFTCVIDGAPTAVEGYRGRIEAELMLGLYSDAVRDWAAVTAYVLPVHPDAESIVLAGYDVRLAIDPADIPALAGKSFAYWYNFEYGKAIQVINDLLAVQPNNLYGNLFRGSNRLLLGASKAGVADIERAIALAPKSPDVHFIVADAYTYGGLADPQRALDEAVFALDHGLDTPRIHAILANAYTAFGNAAAAAAHIQRHIELVTTELVTTAPLADGSSISVDLVPGRTFEIPLPVADGETVSVGTSSHDFYDSILVLLAPDGSPVLGSDDAKQYFAGFKWVATATATYRLRVTSFEGINTGALLVTRN